MTENGVVARQGLFADGTGKGGVGVLPVDFTGSRGQHQLTSSTSVNVRSK